MKKKILTLTSGDDLVDWFFRAIVYTLNEEIDGIKWRHNLRDPIIPNEALCGWLIDEDKIILNDDLGLKEAAVKILIHEVAHAFLSLSDIEERMNRDLENILWLKMSEKQKQIIRTYLPSKPNCKKCKRKKN